jgi:hypothetical protein
MCLATKLLPISPSILLNFTVYMNNNPHIVIECAWDSFKFNNFCILTKEKVPDLSFFSSKEPLLVQGAIMSWRNSTSPFILKIWHAIFARGKRVLFTFIFVFDTSWIDVLYGNEFAHSVLFTWPPLSPDFTQIGFFWGYMKMLVTFH